MAELICTVEREVDGRWLADFSAISGCMAYGATPSEAVAAAYALAATILFSRLEERAIASKHLQVALAELLKKYSHSGACCTFSASGKSVVTVQSCVCNDTVKKAREALSRAEVTP